ncbi:MAG: glycosyltransferase, partial [Bacteroidaceae bacterium]|nr:glycosyltransferase [Bacteroidaceae bacterium]
MEKKKICFVVAVPGSAESFLRDHIAALQAKYEVHLVANFPEGYDGSMFFKNVVFHQIAILRAINIFKDLRAIYSLYKLFRKERFECIHS